MKKIAFSSLLLITLANFNIADACTTLIIKDTQGNAYQGRTMEFGYGLPEMYALYYPQGTKFQSSAPAGSSGLSYEAKYAFTGIGAKADARPDLTIVGGTNEKGITVDYLWFNASQGTSTKAKENVLDSDDMSRWILSQFATVAEVKQAIKKQPIWFEATSFTLKFPLHVAVFDKTGKGIVIEFIKGKLVVWDNPIGVMTNGPDFKWHLTNLNNYVTLSDTGSSRATWNGYHLNAVDAGGNILGLPSDDSTSGRFVRAAFYTSHMEKPDPQHAVAVLGKVMNKFDRINGVTRSTNDLLNGEAVVQKNSKKGTAEWTIYTTLSDLNNGLYYIRTEDSLGYYKIDLKELSRKNASSFSKPLKELAVD